MDQNATITIERGHSEDGGFDWARMASDTLTRSELFGLGERLLCVGCLQRISGYEIVHPYVIKRLGESFTVAQLREFIAEQSRLMDEREERRRLGLVKCACGHTVAKRLVMSASRGSSCPDCYDRMSD